MTPTQVPEAVQAFIRSQGWGDVARARAIGGGCINDGQHLATEAGVDLFLKRNASAPPDMFQREAEGLEAMAAADGGPRVPRPLLAGEDFLLLEYLRPEPPAGDYWAALGEQVARLHQQTNESFGFPHDNYIGSTPQPNQWTADGYAFFGEQRLVFQGRLARERGLLGAGAVRKLEGLAARLSEIVPSQPASLIHGDFWGGNVIAGPGGRACLIDPAAHYGWAEADLAMTALFGRFPGEFYDAYVSVRPLAPGWDSRFEIYNLYHLLNHLNLFGRGYLAGVEDILRAY